MSKRSAVNEGNLRHLVGSLRWSRWWEGCEMWVIEHDKGVFRSVVKLPWEDDAQEAKDKGNTFDQAKRRCFGMIRLACEIFAGKAAEEMGKIHTANISMSGRR